jgi:NAD(P)-dependent dehydrogenase (short-subunit alcohol dehydrogenase family)
VAKSRRWTAEDIPDLTGKTALITGGNSGIGYEAALELARHGAFTIIACRSASRGEVALRRIKEADSSSKVALMLLDLGDLSSISAFVQRFSEAHEQLDVLVNNAGIMATPYRTTKDGFESQFGTNHLGHFALTAKLMPSILAAPSARIVNVSSVGHRRGDIDFNTLLMDRSNYKRWRAYYRSKLANLLFTYEMHRRLGRAQIDNMSSLAAHPGVARTNLGQGMGFVGTLLKPITFMFVQSARMGALPILRAATDPTAQSGQYYGPDKSNEWSGYPVVVSSTPESHDEEAARHLWERSEELTGVSFSIRKR